MVKVSVADGDLIRAVGDLDVYIVKYKGLKKFKRLVLNPSVFNNYGHLKWSNIKEVSKESLASYQDSNLVRSVATGKLYYLIPKGDTGEKRFIADINRLNSLGHDQDSVYEINGYDENYYTIGADM